MKKCTSNIDIISISQLNYKLILNPLTKILI